MVYFCTKICQNFKCIFFAVLFSILCNRISSKLTPNQHDPEKKSTPNEKALFTPVEINEQVRELLTQSIETVVDNEKTTVNYYNPYKPH